MKIYYNHTMSETNKNIIELEKEKGKKEINILMSKITDLLQYNIDISSDIKTTKSVNKSLKMVMEEFHETLLNELMLDKPQ